MISRMIHPILVACVLFLQLFSFIELARAETPTRANGARANGAPANEARANGPVPTLPETLPASSLQSEAVPPELAKAFDELKKVYDLDVKSVLSMSNDDAADIEATSAEDLLAEHDLLTPDLRKHIDESGGLDFDILLSAQDWEKSWTVSVDAPKKSGENYDVRVVLKHPKEQTTVTWKFMKSDGKWLIDDATYADGHQKPFTLRSLNEGD